MTFAPLQSVGATLLALLIGVPEADARPERDCLAKAVYFESRAEPVRGQIAVAQVVINRRNDPRFPGTICGVVFQRVGGKCQFTWACRSHHRVNDFRAWRTAQQVAKFALLGIPDKTGGRALYFQANTERRPPNHGLRRTATIGGHRFFAERKTSR